jgi:hypothetical protein
MNTRRPQPCRLTSVAPSYFPLPLIVRRCSVLTSQRYAGRFVVEPTLGNGSVKTTSTAERGAVGICDDDRVRDYSPWKTLPPAACTGVPWASKDVRRKSRLAPVLLDRSLDGLWEEANQRAGWIAEKRSCPLP